MSDEDPGLRQTTYSYSTSKPTVIRSPCHAGPATEGRVTTHVYDDARPAPAFRFEHDSARGVFRLTWPDGKVEVFRDKPARSLCLEPDESGAMRPVVRQGRPAYLYLAREEREVR